MSDNVDETRPAEQGYVNTTQQPANDIDFSQLYDMFMKIELRLPNFDDMLVAMNDYVFQRTLRERKINDLREFCGVLQKGFFFWFTSNCNYKINNLPDFFNLTNEIFDEDILMKFDKKLVSSTSPNADTDKCIQTSNITDASESTNTNANADAIKITDTSANTDASECINTGDITDISESTKRNASTDSIKSTVTSPNTDACKGTHKNANTDASESTNIITNENITEGPSTSTNVDASKSTLKNANTSSHKSASTYTNKRARMSLSPYSVIVAKHLKYSSEYLRTTTALEAAEELKTLSQSTEKLTKQLIKQSTKRMDRSFKIIMPELNEQNILTRKQRCIDRNIHLGMNYERHWWRQTNDKMVLNVDISDFIWVSSPNIKVEVSKIGFNISIKRFNRWVVLISNKFIKPIRKSKWEINEYMYVKLTMKKKKKEFWGKCLVTEEREHDTSLFRDHTCTKECTAPMMTEEELLPMSPSQERCMKTLMDFLKQSYGMDDEEYQDDIDLSTETNSPPKEE